MAKYRFEQIAINCTEKKMPTDEDRLTYIGLEHLDTGCLTISRWGSAVPLKGEKLVMRRGDVLLGKRNAYLRRAAIAPHDGIFSAHGMVLRPREEVIDKAFFPLFIASDYFFDEAIRISVGSLSPTVNWKDLRITEFELPDLETQRKLASVLWAINDTIEAYKRLISVTDELVKSQFLGEFGDPVANPMHWKTTPLLEMGKCKNGMNFSTKDSGFDISCLGVADFQSRLTIHEDTPLSGISLNEMPGEDYLLKNGDIVFVRSNGNKELVGRSVLVKFTDRIATFSGFCIRFRKEANCLNEIYLLHLLRMDSVRKKLRGRGANVQNLSQQTLANIDVPLPPLPLQEQFAAFVRQSDKSKFAVLNCLKRNLLLILQKTEDVHSLINQSAKKYFCKSCPRENHNG